MSSSGWARWLIHCASAMCRASSTVDFPLPFVPSAQLARQREALSRATAALDRAIDVLMPGAAAPASRVYTASGLSAPLRSSTNLNA